MKKPEFIIDIIILSLMSVVFSTVFVIVIRAKLVNLVSGFILIHLANREIQREVDFYGNNTLAYRRCIRDYIFFVVD